MHNFLSSCPYERIDRVHKDLGRIPRTLEEMLKRFNGAELFCCPGGPTVTLFGISNIPPLPALDWAPEWYIDIFTPEWRAAAPNRQGDWAMAMKNYGGLVLMDCYPKEWDTSECRWLYMNVPLDVWLESVISDGMAAMEEMTLN